jgi:CHAP domain
MKKTMATKLVNLTKAEVGVTEVGNTNCGVRVNEYKSATWLDPREAWPWCAAFVDWCVQQAMLTDGPYTFTRPRTAGAWALEDWSLKQDESTWTLRKPGSDIKPGDIVIFTFSHVGFAVSAPFEDHFSTIEGNTDASGSREGGGVWKKVRKLSQIKTRIRFTV